MRFPARRHATADFGGSEFRRPRTDFEYNWPGWPRSPRPTAPIASPTVAGASTTNGCFASPLPGRGAALRRRQERRQRLRSLDLVRRAPRRHVSAALAHRRRLRPAAVRPPPARTGRAGARRPACRPVRPLTAGAAWGGRRRGSDALPIGAPDEVGPQAGREGGRHRRPARAARTVIWQRLMEADDVRELLGFARRRLDELLSLNGGDWPTPMSTIASS